MLGVKRLCVTVCTLLLAVTGLAVPMSVSALVTDVAKTAVCGDVDGNGTFATPDVRLVLRFVVGNQSLNEQQQAVADYDGNGIVTSVDLREMLCALVGGSATPDTALVPYDEEYYYGRQLLAEEDSNMLAAYDEIGEQLNALNPNIEVYRFELTFDEFQRVLRYYHDDHPEVFWMKLDYSYYYWQDSGITYAHSFQMEYDYTSEEIASLQTALENRVTALLDGITAQTPYAERVRHVHDRLITSAEFDTTFVTPHAHDLLGVIVDGTGVCESYARAFQYLMYRCGINTILRIGDIKSDNSAHMWNALLLNGDWYEMDLTWNDPTFSGGSHPDYIDYAYYNVTTAQMEAERTIYRETAYGNDNYFVTYPTPVCTATAENYFVKNAVELTAFDEAAVAQAIANSILNNDWAVFSPKGTYTTTALQRDFENHLTSICENVNALLPPDKQLSAVAYSVAQNTYYGVFSIRLRSH